MFTGLPVTFVIARTVRFEAIQRKRAEKHWIASNLTVLAMTRRLECMLNR